MFEEIVVFMQKDIAGCELWRVVTFFAVVLGSLIIGRLLRFLMERPSKRSEDAATDVSLLFVKVLARPVVFVVLAVGVWLGLAALNLSGKISEVTDTVSQVLYAAAIGYAIYCLVDMVDHYLGRLAKRTESKVDDMLVPLVRRIANTSPALAQYIRGARSSVTWREDSTLGLIPTLDRWTDVRPVIERMVGPYMGANRKKGLSYRWPLAHIRDGRERAVPRPLVRLFEEAARDLRQIRERLYRELRSHAQDVIDDRSSDERLIRKRNSHVQRQYGSKRGWAWSSPIRS